MGMVATEHREGGVIPIEFSWCALFIHYMPASCKLGYCLREPSMVDKGDGKH